jgi:hypothetical protein
MTQSCDYQRVVIIAQALHKLLFNKHLKKFNGVLIEYYAAVKLKNPLFRKIPRIGYLQGISGNTKRGCL